MALRVIPSLALKGRMPFLVYSREEAREGARQVSLADLEDVVEDLGERWGHVHVLDLDGLEKGRMNYDLIRTLSDAAPLWVEAGAFDRESVMDTMITGAEHVVLGTRFLQEMEGLPDILEITENILISVEWDGGILAPSERVSRMGISDLGRTLLETGVENVIFTDGERIRGRTRSLNYVCIRDLVECGLHVYASGGCSMEDIDPLERLEVSGMLVEAGLLLDGDEHDG